MSTSPAASLARMPAAARQVTPAVGRWALGQLRAARQAPATLTYVGVLRALGALTGSLVSGPSPRLLERVGAGVPALNDLRLYTALTSALWAPNLVGYLAWSLVVLAVGMVAERRWGTLRFVVVAASVQALGVAVGCGAVAAGLTMVYSGSAGTLWRRRLRIGVLSTLLTFMLYGGLLEDVIRLSSALVGLAVGAVLVRHGPRQVLLRSSRHETRVLVAVVLAATALGPILAAASPSAVGPLATLRYLFTSSAPSPARLTRLCSHPRTVEACAELGQQFRAEGIGPAVLSVLPSLLVLLVAFGLLKGRRFAFWAAVVVHAVLAGLGVFLTLSVVFAPSQDLAALLLADSHRVVGLTVPWIQPIAVLVVLVLSRGAFDLSAPRGTYVRAGRAVGLTAVLLFLGYVLLGRALADGFLPRPGLVDLAVDFPVRLVPPGYLGIVESTFLPANDVTTILFEWTGVLMWGAVIVQVLRSYRRWDRNDADEDAVAARAILLRDGHSALSYLSTWRGNSYWFTGSGCSYVAYRVQGGVAITTGDPVGPAYERAHAAQGFVRFCDANGWTPCFYSVTGPLTEVTLGWGWPRVQVAEETMLPLGGLAFTGKKFQDVRSAFNKAGKEGITAEWVGFGAAPRSVRDQITEISEEWVADKGLPEMGFTLGGLDELDDPAVRCLLAVDSTRTVQAVTSWLPVYRDGVPIGWTLDFMRRRSDGPKGMMEFLIGSATLRFQEEGAEFVSLSGAPLARVDADAPATGLQRLLDVMGRRLEPVYGFGSLLAFKAKFQPVYQPLFMAYPEAAALPRIATGISRAYLPHLTVRQVGRLLRRF